MKYILICLITLCIAAIVCGEGRVKVVVMTESLCPNCHDFINKDFKEFMQAKDLFDYVDFKFLAWGNAYTETTSPKLCPSPTPGKYNVDIRKCWSSRCVRNAEPQLFAECFNISFDEHTTCQHGKDECLGNRIETCTLYIARNRTNGYLTRNGAEFVECFMGDNHGKTSSTLSCTKRAGIDYDTVMACVNSNLGTMLLSEEAVETNDFGTHPGVPYPLVNGEPLPDGKSLVKAICEKIQGSQPKTCKRFMFTSRNSGMC